MKDFLRRVMEIREQERLEQIAKTDLFKRKLCENCGKKMWETENGSRFCTGCGGIKATRRNKPKVGRK